MISPRNLLTSTSVRSIYICPSSKGLFSKNLSQKAYTIQTNVLQLPTSLYVLLVHAIRMIQGFSSMALIPLTPLVWNGSIKSKWWKNRWRVHQLCMTSNSIACAPIIFLPGNGCEFKRDGFIQLTVEFLQGSTSPQSCWTMVGVGIRLAQDIRADRWKNHGQTVTAEDEQWKRGFWYFIFFAILSDSEQDS